MKQSSLIKKILSIKRTEVHQARKARSLQLLKEDLARAPATRNFLEAVRRKRPFEVNLIAEIKRASPSKGLIRPKLDPAAMAKELERGGAVALSVLTERKYFHGSLEDLRQARAACTLPVLRKDFIVEEYQVFESRLAGADAILLIAGLLSQNKLEAFTSLARNLSLAPLIEVHTAAELKRVLGMEAPLIGINSRDLATMKIDPELARDLRQRIPADRIVVYESGIEEPKQVTPLREMRFDAMLVGGALMKARNTVGFIHQLLYP